MGTFGDKLVQLQPRDLGILKELFICRTMTLRHATLLHFNGKSEAAKKRIQKLKGAGFLTERHRHGAAPAVLFLTRAGFKVLSDRQLLTIYPPMNWGTIKDRAQVSELTMRHELSVMDVKVAISTSLKNMRAYEVTEFSTWPLMFQFEACPGANDADILVKPDGFIRIHETDIAGDRYEHTFYLEVDRSTETQEHLVAKAGCYVDHYRRGGLAVQFGRPASEYKDFPFRTLLVLQNAERRNNTAERLLMRQPPILSQVWLTTMKEMLADPLGKIWIRPMDYREVTTGTAFEPGGVGSTHGYRRQSAREVFVEHAIKKQKLIDAERST